MGCSESPTATPSWGVSPVREGLTSDGASLVKSRQRIADHGEVFTPAWLVEDMLNLVEAETERIDARVLEPACGSGNFLVPVLRRKLATVEARYSKSDFEKGHQTLLALMSIYGIELLADNAEECRANLLAAFCLYLGLDHDDVWRQAATKVLAVNIVQGDAVTMKTPAGEAITFAEWAYLGKGEYQRRDFRFESLTRRSSIKGTLYEALDEHELFKPTQTHPPMSVEDIAR